MDPCLCESEPMFRSTLYRRAANHLPKSKLLRLAHALWTSKLRYGLQLCSNVRIIEDETKNAHIKKAQLAQNKILRLLDNSTLKDRKSTCELLQKFDMLSVNQLAASIKLTEIWKSIKG